MMLLAFNSSRKSYWGSSFTKIYKDLYKNDHNLNKSFTKLCLYKNMLFKNWATV